MKLNADQMTMVRAKVAESYLVEGRIIDASLVTQGRRDEAPRMCAAVAAAEGLLGAMFA